MTHKTLPEFITAVGDDEAGKLFGVKKRTAQSWRLRTRIPRPKQAEFIIKNTRHHPKGPVTFEGIYSIDEESAA